MYLEQKLHAFADLATRVENALLPRTVVLDGEIVCLDEKGCPQFNDLLFRRGTPTFVVFDLLFDGERDLRHERLSDRNMELRRILGGTRSPLMYADHLEQFGSALFEKACELDLEGIVAKRNSAPYLTKGLGSRFAIRAIRSGWGGTSYSSVTAIGSL